VSIRALALAGAATGVVLGIIAGLAGWSRANTGLAGAIATIVGGGLLIAVPDMLGRRRR
jgi:hypothetical protein